MDLHLVGENEPGGPRASVHLRIPKVLKARLTKFRNEHHWSESVAGEVLIEEALDMREGSPTPEQAELISLRSQLASVQGGQQ